MISIGYKEKPSFISLSYLYEKLDVIAKELNELNGGIT